MAIFWLSWPSHVFFDSLCYIQTANQNEEILTSDVWHQEGCQNSNHHHHSFNVSVPLKVGRTAPMFVLSFFFHSILLAGSALDSFQCLRSLLIVSFHVFFGLPRPRCPTTSNSDAVNTTIIPYNMPKPT